MTEPGFEEFELDLSLVPTVEIGLSDAAKRYQLFAKLANESLGPGQDKVLRIAHLPLMSFINRARVPAEWCRSAVSAMANGVAASQTRRTLRGGCDGRRWGNGAGAAR